uniref:Molybdate-anion transporter n=1 Tax=Odontella aurita TaxID=265563 RepID=A0A7S4JRP7_9STRA|mmetsp:Transcript_52597/g.157602  ORF Transcript_52597/g.157602 Transcript_52597/m.157602 type:complete len:526 (+) Transcript_52597:179-1756(+)|eukprot:CAMPEP_0113559170 /NCGR_PEP_ID=MMETSP0015_2-20120614/18746_1 /TAXON_ID=2838 /ORGANISM="Odontella" /LENGTH=525 /DNA_ID=CAMNT_0000460773 /DNA_START=55 /DNA_END=1632 /DNA_ORIENTATION=+ /assembly_acc=CAM_ASM_000160
MANYTLIFGVTLLVNVVVTLRSSGLYERFCKKPDAPSEDDGTGGDVEDPSSFSKGMTKEEEKAKHAALLRRYLSVYLLAVLSDWLQGPYVYALYDNYGYSQHLIAVLFVAGFGSSMVFGSFIGGMADHCGRKKFVVLFSVIYAMSCMTKHYKNFHILMLGRLLGGVATSLLFSVFDSWLIRAHADAKIDRKYLSKSFSSASYGNSLVAIGAGLLANKAAGANKLAPFFSNDADVADAPESATTFYTGGYLNPFDLSLMALVLCGILATVLWEENYGDTSGDEDGDDSGKQQSRWYDALKNASVVTWRSTDILLCGTISSLFEGSMYIFVFMWTPALTSLTKKEDDDKESESLPFGLIFSTFMVCCMAGSSLFSILVERMRGEVMAIGVFLVSSIAMAVICTSNSDTVTFCSMNVFEMCVGMYWPIMGTMKGAIVPEDKRAAIYNLFRIPLNFIVLTSLLTDLTPTQSFMANASMLGLATVLQFRLTKRRSNMAKAVISGKAEGAEGAEEKEKLLENDEKDVEEAK